MPAIVIPSRRCGKHAHRQDALGLAALGILYDAGGEAGFGTLWDALPCTRRELWRILARLATMGAIRRHREGEPIVLTATARMSVEAGRLTAARRTDAHVMGQAA